MQSFDKLPASISVMLNPWSGEGGFASATVERQVGPMVVVYTCVKDELHGNDGDYERICISSRKRQRST